MYRLGVGDILYITRLQTRIDSNTGQLFKIPVSFEALIEQDGSAQIIELDGRVQLANMTLMEAQDTIRRELLRSGLSTEMSLSISDFRSKSIVMTGALGNALIPLTIDVNSIDRILSASCLPLIVKIWVISQKSDMTT